MKDKYITGAYEMLNLDEDAKNRILTNVKEKCANRYVSPGYKRSIGKRIIISAVIIFTFVLMGGVALSAGIFIIIKQISFNDGVALLVEQNERDINTGHKNVWYEYEIRNRQLIYQNDKPTLPIIILATADYIGLAENALEIVWHDNKQSAIEEANKRAPIYIYEPHFLPENAKLDQIILLGIDDSAFVLPYAFLLYVLSNDETLSVVISDIGTDASIQATFTHPFEIELVLIGEIEGLLISYPGGYQTGECKKLVWVNDGVNYTISLSSLNRGNTIDNDILIAIARSMP